MNNVNIKTIAVISIVVIFGLAAITTVGSYFSYNNNKESTQSKHIMETGIDDNVNLFKK